MKFTRRQTHSTLRTILPLLTLVWASLPLHQCNLALAEPVPAAVSSESEARAPAPCGHHVADDAAAPKASMPCSDLGRVAPDLRPSIGVVDVPVQVSFDSRWLERGLRPVSAAGVLRPQDDGRWRPRPLHLQKSVLLI